MWRARPWAKWFAAASGCIYLPFEFFELVEHINWISLGSLTLNIARVAFILYSLRRPGNE